MNNEQKRINSAIDDTFYHMIMTAGVCGLNDDEILAYFSGVAKAVLADVHKHLMDKVGEEDDEE